MEIQTHPNLTARLTLRESVASVAPDQIPTKLVGNFFPEHCGALLHGLYCSQRETMRSTICLGVGSDRRRNRKTDRFSRDAYLRHPVSEPLKADEFDRAHPLFPYSTRCKTSVFMPGI